MQVDIKQLAAALRKAPPFALPEMNEGTSYLYNRVYNRLVNGDIVRLSDLDFSAFEEDGIRALCSLYDDVIEKNAHHANSIANILREAAPICKAAAYI
jgi:hypothetical protein